MASEKTIIKFRFLKPGAFSIPGSGNFWPSMRNVAVTLPGVLGNTWVVEHDMDALHVVELPDEMVRELPAHIKNHTDQETRLAYQRRAAEKAAELHAENNAARDILAYQESVGRIKIVSDSFFDGDDAPTPTPAEPAKPAKAPKADKADKADKPTETEE